MKTFKDTKYGDLTGQHYKGDINVRFKNLNSLEGAPKTVNGDFWCSFNKLTSLEGAPETVNGNFSCSSNNLTSLKGAPETVGGDFWCENNKKLTTKDFEELLLCDIKGTIKIDKGLKLPNFKLFKTVGKDIKKYRKIMKLKDLK